MISVKFDIPYEVLTGYPSFMRRGKALWNVAQGLFVTAFGGFMVFGTFDSHAQAAESSFTQAHGIREKAAVSHVHTEQSYSQYGGYANTCLTVILQTPVRGRTRTVVNLSYVAHYTDGQVIAVLVNPGDPGYAELPGEPYVEEWQTAGMGLFAAFMLVSGLAITLGAAGASPSGTNEKPPKTYDEKPPKRYEKPLQIYDENLPQTYDDDPPEIYYYFRRI